MLFTTTPPVANLSGRVTRGDYPRSSGSFADVYSGVLRVDGSQRQTHVALKVIRSYTVDENVTKKRVDREIRIWAKLHHKNVLPLLGLSFDFGNKIAMICPWIDGGNLREYVDSHAYALSFRDRLQLLLGIADGLAYLHSHGIVHGDLHSGNILIDQGIPCLSDFGLSSLIDKGQNPSYTNTIIGGALRWAAPELLALDDEDPIVTTCCDVYSFASITLEVLSGRMPYFYVKHDGAVLRYLMRGNLPRCPPSSAFPKECWAYILLCWGDPGGRPTMRDVLQQLRTWL